LKARAPFGKPLDAIAPQAQDETALRVKMVVTMKAGGTRVLWAIAPKVGVDKLSTRSKSDDRRNVWAGREGKDAPQFDEK